jgi:Na+/H+ antiporter NhaC
MRSTRARLFLLSLGLFLAGPRVISSQEVAQAPKVVLGGVPFSVTVRGGEAKSEWFEIRSSSGALLASGTVGPGASTVASDIVVSDSGELPLSVVIGSTVLQVDIPYAPGWFSLAPPVLAIVLALLFREVLTSLFAGIWLGALVVAGYNPLAALWRTVDSYAVPMLGDVANGKTQIVVFSLLLGGMVGLIARNGGTQGVVDAVTPFSSTPRRGKIATWLAGLAIFFDDYANTLIVGNTMRPITDRLKVSREKLAYIVDSTAAPVAALVPISTWVGYEISLIAQGLGIAAEQNAADATLSAALAAANPFAVFISTIPYLFYPLLALAFVFMTSIMNRDFGPMATAEVRAARGEGLYREGAQLAVDTSGHLMQPKEGVTPRWYNAAVPVLTIVFVVLFGLYWTGRKVVGADASLMDVFGAADPFATLLWGSLAGCLVAILMSVGQKILTVQEALDAWVGGMKAMFIAMIILVMAWSLGQVTQDLGTAAYLSQILSDTLALEFVPILVFVTAAAMAFATGTSWTTMAILIPLVIPLTVSLGGAAGFAEGEYSILLGSISSVLAGAIFGDHCSPISDTTVLSSTAAACDHMDHVRTQMPYALLVAVIGMLLGDFGTSHGLPTWVALGGGVLILFIFLRFVGKPVVEDAPDDVAVPAAG